MTRPATDREMLAARLVDVANAARREDGSDIPLGMLCRRAAALLAQPTPEPCRAPEGWRPARQVEQFVPTLLGYWTNDEWNTVYGSPAAYPYATHAIARPSPPDQEPRT